MYLEIFQKMRDKKINPNIQLPDLPVATVQRSDGSGTISFLQIIYQN